MKSSKLISLLPFLFIIFTSNAQKKKDWVVLFDGTDSGKLRGYKMEAFPSDSWEIADGMLSTKTDVQNVDMVTTNTYKNFELLYEWKASKGGNSGLFFHVKELYDMVSGNGNSPNWLNDFEIQIQDDPNYPDKDPKRSAGALYDLIAPPSDKILKPFGEFNQARLVVNRGKVSHYLNGKKILEFKVGSDELNTKIRNSKFKNNMKYGTSKTGHIMFQHHGQKMWFKNIKVRKL